METNATSAVREFADEVILPFSDCPPVPSSPTKSADQAERMKREHDGSIAQRGTIARVADASGQHGGEKPPLGRKSARCDGHAPQPVGVRRHSQSNRTDHAGLNDHTVQGACSTGGALSGGGTERTAASDTLVALSEVPILDAVGYVFNALLGKNGTLPLRDLLSLFLDASGEIKIEHLKPFVVNEWLGASLSRLRVKGIETLSLPLFHSMTETTIDSSVELETLHVAGDISATAGLPRVITLCAPSVPFGVHDAALGSAVVLGSAEKWVSSTWSSERIMINETVSVSAGVQDMVLDAVVQVYLDSLKVRELNQAKAKEPECVAELAKQGSCVLSLAGSLKFSEFIVSTTNETSLESGLLQAVSNGFVFARPFNEHLGAVIRYVLETQVKPAVNDKISRELGRQHDCPDVHPKHEILINIPITIIASLLCSGVFLAIVIFYVAVSGCGKSARCAEHRNEEQTRLLGVPESGGAGSPVGSEPLESSATTRSQGVLAAGAGGEKGMKEYICTSRSGGGGVLESSLLFSKELSVVSRLGIPLLGLFIAVLFVSSNVSYAAAVVPVLYPREERQEDPITLSSMFNFNLKNSVVDMWNAGVYPLSILVLVFSGAWPYIKIALFLFAWVMPTRVLPSRKRGQLLIALDALGKWSLIDSFMMVSMVVAFHFRVEFPHYLAGVHDHFVAGIIVEVCYGMSSFLCATLLSLVLIHSALACHRKVTEPGSSEGDVNRLSVVGFYVRAAKNKRAAVVTGTVIALSLFVTLLILVAGIFVYSFQFNFLGAAGLLLELFDIPTSQPYSVYSLVKSMPLFAPSGTLPAVYFVVVAFVLTVAVFPVVHIVVTAFLWLVPLHRRQQRTLNVVSEVMNAWSAIEVYTLIILVELLEIRQFAAFIVEDTCRDITPVLERYFTPLLGEGNAKCFDVTATLLPGVWLFLAAAILYVITTMYTMAVCRKTFAQRERWEVAEHRRSSVN